MALIRGLVAATSLGLAACSSSSSKAIVTDAAVSEVEVDATNVQMDGTSGVDAGTAEGDSAAETSSQPLPDAGVDAALPSIDPSTTVPELTAAQKGELCDWIESQLGGYGVTITCPAMKTIQNYANESECEAVMFRSGCAYTVGQLEACIEGEAPSMGCSFPASLCQQVVNCP
jgi:hypothetical protein